MLWGSYLRGFGRVKGSKRGVFEGSRGSLLRCLGRFRGFRCLVLLAALGLLPLWFRTCKGVQKGRFRGLQGVPSSVFRTI